jgi:hypothetical protein
MMFYVDHAAAEHVANADAVLLFLASTRTASWLVTAALNLPMVNLLPAWHDAANTSTELYPQ